jgi:hypothetical protein
MQIVRDKGTLVGVVTASDEERIYVPSRSRPSFKTALMIGSLGLEAQEYQPVKRERAERNGEQEVEKNPIQSRDEIVKNEFDENQNDKTKKETVGICFERQGLQSFKTEAVKMLGMGDHRNSAHGGRTTAREPGFRKHRHES